MTLSLPLSLCCLLRFQVLQSSSSRGTTSANGSTAEQSRLRASQPRKQLQVFRKSQELICGRTTHCERPSICRLARFPSGSSARDPPAQKPSGTFDQKISDCHALYALALHGVVPRLAVCLHSLFSEECLYRDLHVYRRSSRKVCSSRSMAVGGARLAQTKGGPRLCPRPSCRTFSACVCVCFCSSPLRSSTL